MPAAVAGLGKEVSGRQQNLQRQAGHTSGHDASSSSGCCQLNGHAMPRPTHRLASLTKVKQGGAHGLNAHAAGVGNAAGRGGCRGGSETADNGVALGSAPPGSGSNGWLQCMLRPWAAQVFWRPSWKYGRWKLSRVVLTLVNQGRSQGRGVGLVEQRAAHS